MRHYEIVFLVHPDQSEQVFSMIERYKTLIKNNQGVINRFEDWGRRPLAYPIAKVHKAHYVLLNIECSNDTLKEITNNFRFNDAILRHLVLHRKFAITEPSVMLRQKEERKNQGNSNSLSVSNLPVDKANEAVVEAKD